MPAKKSVAELVKTIEHRDFVAYLRKVAPNREWTAQYMDLLKELLEAVGLTDEDYRLAMSTPVKTDYFLAVTVNNNRIMSGYYNDGKRTHTAERRRFCTPSVAFLFPTELLKNTEEKKKAKFIKIEKRSNNRGFVYIDNLNNIHGFKDDLLKVIQEQKEVLSRTTRKAHQSVFYYAVADLKYRERVFNEVWPVETETLHAPAEDVSEVNYSTLRNALDGFLGSNTWHDGVPSEHLLNLNTMLLASAQAIQSEIVKRHATGMNTTQGQPTQQENTSSSTPKKKTSPSQSKRPASPAPSASQVASAAAGSGKSASSSNSTGNGKSTASSKSTGSGKSAASSSKSTSSSKKGTRKTTTQGSGQKTAQSAKAKQSEEVTLADEG